MRRRDFLYAGCAGALCAGSGDAAALILDPNRLAKFVDRLPVPERARSSGVRAAPHDPASKFPYYRLRMTQVESKVHRDLPATRFWGFGSSSPGPTIEARRGEPLLVEWVNDLPREHFLPVDRSIHGAGPRVPAVRTVVHLHGGRVPPASDGYPDNWFQPGGSSTNFYPNEQEATMLWYHDHAMAITRLNIFAGLFGLYLIRDATEDALHLPAGEQEIPLILCDRSFGEDGQLSYPVSADPERPWVPEFSGEAILVNGKLFPYCDVQPRRYRLRLLNASNSRFYYLSLSNGQSLWQIGSDQGLLASPVELKRLTLAAAERADLIVDFCGHERQNIVLKSDAYTLVQFRVSEKADSDDSAEPLSLRPIAKIPEHAAVRTRMLTLTGPPDADDPTNMSQPMLLNDSRWHDPVTENPTLGSVEIWSFVNLTDDSHPIHLHLVRFQILDRRPFDLFTYLNDEKLRYTAAAIPPDMNEAGWKDTVRADPGMVTRIIVRFEGFAGRYVWHCHVL
ncbi:MAG: multicopper oxidase family protein [Bryobacteraceae bacterium]